MEFTVHSFTSYKAQNFIALHTHKFTGLKTKEMKAIKSHRDLQVYQKSLDLVVEVYKLTSSFPKTELYGLTNQLRRAAVSVPSNIAEGAGRNSKKEFIRFLHIALGSINEIETQIEIAKRLKYIDSVKEISENFIHIKRMLLKLIESLKRSV